MLRMIGLKIGRLQLFIGGGSRKMIAENPYSNIYDEDWNLSLNHDIFRSKI